MKPWTIHAVVPPGLEGLAKNELHHLGVKTVSEHAGGLGFSCHDRQLFRLHHLARIPSRFLVVLGQFRARHFSELVDKAKALEIPAFTGPLERADLRISCRHCKLYHSDAIAERLHLLWNSRPDAKGQRIQLRGEDDHFTLSIDASGEHLHRRGILRHRGSAPLRENLAAALIQATTPEGPIWDPFCGSGTLAVESLLQETRTPIGRFRSFAFQHWPKHRTDVYADDLASLEAERQQPTHRHRLGDHNPSELEACRHNLEAVGWLEWVDVREEDFFQATPPEGHHLITNPPYERRLKGAGDLFARLDGWKPFPAHLLLPRNRRHPGFRGILKFKNGGQAVHLLERSVDRS